MENGLFTASRLTLVPDADTASVEEVSVASANISDGKAGSEASLDNPGEVFVDSAYRGNHFRDVVRAKGGIPRIILTGMWGRDEQEILRKLHGWNQPFHRVLGRIAKIFGTWKRCYGFRRMRWRGLAKSRRPSPPNSHRLQPETHNEYSRRSGMKNYLALAKAGDRWTKCHRSNAFLKLHAHPRTRLITLVNKLVIILVHG
jgi:hypothetical protein